MAAQPTVLELLKKAAPFLEEAGIETSRLDAEVLLANILDMDRIHLYVNFDRPLEPVEVDTYRTALVKRAKHIPLAYITGKREFLSLEFAVTPDVLVPRPETELLVESVIERVSQPEAEIVDVGTGSGVIAICLAKQPNIAKVWAVDISDAALAVARSNGETHGVNGKIQWLRGDLLAPLAKIPAVKVDAIVSNPPYVAAKDIGEHSREVRYEPRQALDGGPDGLVFYRRLVAEAPQYLRKSGFLFLEIGYNQGDQVRRLAESTGLYGSVEVLPDLAGLDRVVIGQKK